MSGAPVTTTAPELVLDDVTAGYFANDVVLHNVSIRVRPGAVTAVLGPNGSGKSTTLRILAGFLHPRTGRVRLGEEDLTEVGVADRLHRGVALLPQGRSVFPGLSVLENLRLGAWMLRHERGAMQTAVETMLERYPTLQQFRDKPAGSLSGGQARLVEFARLLITDPTVLLIDEPSVGLAPVLVDEVYDEIVRLKEEGRTILLVDQNVQAAVEIADYVYTLAYGRNHLDGGRDQFAGQLDELIRTWLSL